MSLHLNRSQDLGVYSLICTDAYVCEEDTHWTQKSGDGGTDNFSQLTTVGDWKRNRDISKSYHVHCSGIHIHIDAWTAILHVCVQIHIEWTELVPEKERLENY